MTAPSGTQRARAATCRCGAVAFEAVGEPIFSVTCYCTSCQEAGRRFARLPEVPPVVGADGGTDFVVYRKDRVRCVQGGELLEEHRLTTSSSTRRVLAACCGSPIFLEFAKGHWLSMYGGGFADGAPAPEMRVMTRDRPAGVELADDLPSYGTHSFGFMWRLFAAWAAMGFRTPAPLPAAPAPETRGARP